MIKATKGLAPLYVHFYDNNAATIYNLTEDQFKLIMESEDGQARGSEAAEMFEVELDYDLAYVPDYLMTLCKIHGFEVGSE